jgi:hypothetical protein
MYVCMYINTHTCVFMSYTYIHVCIFYMHSTYIYIYIYTNMCLFTSYNLYIYMYTSSQKTGRSVARFISNRYVQGLPVDHMEIYIHIYICIYMNIYIYTSNIFTYTYTSIVCLSNVRENIHKLNISVCFFISNRYVQGLPIGHMDIHIHMFICTYIGMI